jgi:cytochrome c oxidase subunit 2
MSALATRETTEATQVKRRRATRPVASRRNDSVKTMTRRVGEHAGRLAALVLGGVGLFACSVAGPPPTPPATELFQLCAQCHGSGALGNQAVNAPEIAGLPQWYIEAQLKKFKAGGRGTHFDDLTGMQMRPMAMSLRDDNEIKTIAAYVSTLPPQKPAITLKGDPNHGKTLFAPCTACHQADGSGSEQLKAPPLNHANDWYLVGALKKFKLGIRGSNALDTSGALMRPMSMTLVDDQAVTDVVTYIDTLQK